MADVCYEMGQQEKDRYKGRARGNHTKESSWMGQAVGYRVQPRAE